MNPLASLLRRELLDPLLLREIPPPRWPDTLVFGPPLPDGAELRVPVRGIQERHCQLHRGVSWAGDDGCWCCAAGMPGVTA